MELEDELFQRHAQEEKLYRAVLAEYQEFLSLPSTQERLQRLDYNASLSDYGEALRSLGEIIENFRSSLPAREDCELSA